MGTIGVHEFITLDGRIDTPSWTVGYPFDPKMGPAIAGLMDPGGAILLGRTTYEMFAPAWSVRTAEEDPGAPFFNDTPKYVVSSTLQSADWKNSSVLGRYAGSAVTAVRPARPGGGRRFPSSAPGRGRPPGRLRAWPDRRLGSRS